MIIGYLSLLLGYNTDTTNEEKNYDGQTFQLSGSLPRALCNHPNTKC